MKYTEPGIYSLKYKAVDECGNESVQNREVIVEALGELPYTLIVSDSTNGETIETVTATITGTVPSAERFMRQHLDVSDYSSMLPPTAWTDNGVDVTDGGMTVEDLISGGATKIDARVSATPILNTYLINDGTLLVNARPSQIDSGNVVATYAPLDENNPYDFTGISQRPWNANSSRVKKLAFGNPTVPTSLSYWFQTSALEEVDWTNFYGREVTKADRFAAGTPIREIVLPNMPKLTTLRYAFNRCEQLTKADFSDVGSSSVTDITDIFQGCYALLTVDMSGITGTITAADRAFANASGDGKGDMKIKTIWANTGLTFTAGANMFRSCTSLVGGNGTVYNSSNITYAMAHVDVAGNPGYFTAK